MKLNLDFYIEALTGEKLADNVAKIFAKMLIAQPDTQDNLKFDRIARELYSTGCCEVDEADLVKLKNAVSQNITHTVLAKAPIERALNDCKDCQEK